MYNPRLLMQKLQRQQQTPHHPPQHLTPQPPPLKPPLPLLQTHSQRLMHQTPMFPVRAGDLERFLQVPNVPAAQVLGGEGLDVRVDVCFAVGGGGGVGDGDFEGGEGVFPFPC
jgi:hypothetical protein